MIVIVGGGITGLSLALELEHRQFDCIVLEATDRTGGVIRSATVDGRVLDWGPQRVRMTAPINRLVQMLGLESQVLFAPPDLDLFVYHSGRLRKVPFTPGAFVRSDIVGAAAKLRVLFEPFTAGARPDESVARYFSRKVGSEFYDAVIAPLYGGIYGSDPEEMVVSQSLAHALREFRVGRSLLLALLRRGGSIRPPSACSFRSGMQALPDAIARRLGPRVRTSAPVRAISASGSGWQVEFSGGVIDAATVVLTTPASEAARILAPVAPGAADAVGALRYNPLAVVHLHAKTTLRGLGFQVALTEPAFALRGVTFNESLFGREGLLTAYIGGSNHPEVVKLSDDAIGERAVDDFRACTGHDASVLSVAREWMPAWDHSWSSLTGLTLPHGIHIATNWHSRPGIAGRLADAARTAHGIASTLRK